MTRPVLWALALLSAARARLDVARLLRAWRDPIVHTPDADAKVTACGRLVAAIRAPERVEPRPLFDVARKRRCPDCLEWIHLLAAADRRRASAGRPS